MMRFAKFILVVLMVGMFVPAFALDEVQFSGILKTAVNADEYLYSLMEPGMPKHSPEFQAALATQRKARTAIENEVNAIDTLADIEQALTVAKAFSAQTGYAREIGRLTESLIARRLPFVKAHQIR